MLLSSVGLVYGILFLELMTLSLLGGYLGLGRVVIDFFMLGSGGADI